MVVGVARVTFGLPGNRSLKGKRKVMKSLIDRTRHKFNVSVAEVAAQDAHDRGVIGVAVAGGDSRVINSLLDHITGFMESLHLAEPLERRMEILHVEPEKPFQGSSAAAIEESPFGDLPFFDEPDED